MADVGHNKPQDEAKGPGYEKQDVKSSALIGGMLIVLGAGVIIQILLAGMLYLFYVHYEKTNVPPSPLALVPQVPPEPRLQPNPPAELAEYLRREKSLLDSYGWVDRKGGVVRIPVARALALVEQKGFPPRQHSLVTTSTLSVRLSSVTATTATTTTTINRRGGKRGAAEIKPDSSGRVGRAVALPLVKPDVRISRIRLS